MASFRSAFFRQSTAAARRPVDFHVPLAPGRPSVPRPTEHVQHKRVGTGPHFGSTSAIAAGRFTTKNYNKR